MGSTCRFPNGLEVHSGPVQLTNDKLRSYLREVVITGRGAILEPRLQPVTESAEAGTEDRGTTEEGKLRGERDEQQDVDGYEEDQILLEELRRDGIEPDELVGNLICLVNRRILPVGRLSVQYRAVPKHGQARNDMEYERKFQVVQHDEDDVLVEVPRRCMYPQQQPFINHVHARKVEGRNGKENRHRVREHEGHVDEGHDLGKAIVQEELQAGVEPLVISLIDLLRPPAITGTTPITALPNTKKSRQEQRQHVRKRYLDYHGLHNFRPIVHVPLGGELQVLALEHADLRYEVNVLLLERLLDPEEIAFKADNNEQDGQIDVLYDAYARHCLDLYLLVVSGLVEELAEEADGDLDAHVDGGNSAHDGKALRHESQAVDQPLLAEGLLASFVLEFFKLLRIRSKHAISTAKIGAKAVV